MVSGGVGTSSSEQSPELVLCVVVVEWLSKLIFVLAFVSFGIVLVSSNLDIHSLSQDGVSGGCLDVGACVGIVLISFLLDVHSVAVVLVSSLLDVHSLSHDGVSCCFDAGACLTLLH